MANLPSELAVKASCGGGDLHRFAFRLPAWSLHVGKPIYVCGISIHGGNPQLTNSPQKLQ